MSFRKTIFVTGFPGFIAGRLVKRLAASDTQFFLLVQKHFVDKAMEDVGEIARQTKTPLENFALIVGDITREDLGMSEEDIAAVRAQTTDIFHLAAVYDLEVPRDIAQKVNVDGTRNINTLALNCPNLKRYNYVSTCYVAGLRLGEIKEHELEHDKGFRNYYEETKYEAELEVEKLKDRLPVTIFRPSVVCGDSETGETAKYDGIYYVIKYLLRAPSIFRLVNVGNDKVRLNLVPVDFVVNGMAALSEDDAATGKTIALADPKPLTTREICDAIAESITGKRSVYTPPPSWIEKFLNSPVSPSLTGLPHSGVPYFFVPQTYDTEISESLLEKHGITCPRFDEYAGIIVDYVRKNPRGPA